jgi:hypothetical protein
MLILKPEFKGIIAIEGNIIKLSNKNQVFYDNGYYVIEQFEFVQNGVDMFSVFMDFKTLEEAVKYGLKVTNNNRNRLSNEILNKREEV